MNSIAVVGRLTADPTIKDVNGRNVCSFRVADDSGKKRGDEYVTNFFDVSIWGVRAENASKMLRKGHRVFVEGLLTSRAYKDRNGVERSVMEIDANSARTLETRAEAESIAERNSPVTPPAAAKATAPAPIFDSDLPF